MDITDPDSQFHILVVEDEPIGRKVLQRTLNQEGYQVKSVENGVEALELFKETFFPIVITDWMMPEMNGIELCKAIRKQPASGYVYIIILTAKGSKEDIVEGLTAGADDFMSKPFSPAELKSRIKTGTRILHLERSLKEAHEEIRLLSITDSLTSCYNRGYITDRLPHEIQRAVRYQHPLSIVLCDIDRFKEINDKYGHQAGDQVLIDIVHSIRESLRNDIDWVARYGGEEFLIVLPETSPKNAFIVADRLRRVIANRKFVIRGKEIRVTSSFGVSGFGPDVSEADISLDAMINRADQFLYECKMEGRNRVKGGPESDR